jgi:exopolyphosphatase/guanosine-5'-triphosphate,3'-diphosphate pyrophosphatase
MARRRTQHATARASRPGARGRARGTAAARRARTSNGEADTIAAVDLGSNSFHMVVARVLGGQPQRLDRLRERVALASGLGPDKRLSREAQERALQTLRRFGQRVRSMPAGSVRAVGTNTLRQVRGPRGFLVRARRALGHPIEVVSGTEEARLIYLGVAHELADDGLRRLVVDVGGGSTECILGEGLDPRVLDSLYMGCISWSGRYFPRGRITRERFDRAVLAARHELEPIERRYRERGWQRCIGASGTVLSIANILRAAGHAEQGIDLAGLLWLRKEAIVAGRSASLRMEGLSAERAEVLPGGLAILLALFEGLGIERMGTSPGSLRDGLLWDLIGRIHDADARERSIRRFQERYHVDVEQAERVRVTALACLEQVANAWGLTDDDHARMLAWAARLHEIGLSVAYSGHHRHGAYLVVHADMPGFSREGQELLGALVGGHRRKLSKEDSAALAEARGPRALRLCVLLRLAVCLNRSRGADPLPRLRLKATPRRLELGLPRGWLARHPLTQADLEEEAGLLKAVGLQLRFG